MPRRPVILLVASLAAVCAGCATGPNADLTPDTAAAFVAQASSTDLFEIESSRLALQRSTNTALRVHAERMIRDHGNTRAQLKTAAASAGVGVPAGMLPMHAAMLGELQRSNAFDDLYRRQQLEIHQQALALVINYVRRGNVPQLRGIAAANVPVIRGHLDHLRLR